MGMLNHLFGDKKSVAKEMVVDRDKRTDLWQKYLSNLRTRYELSRHFRFSNMAVALNDWEATLKVLDQLDSLISDELINVEHEEKAEHEIITDIGRLMSNDDIHVLSRSLIYQKDKEKKIYQLFHELHDVLKLEKHLMKIIKTKPSNVQDLLLRLFKLISHNELSLCDVFDKNYYDKEDSHLHGVIADLARSVILQEEWKEKEETAEQIFAREVYHKIYQTDSKNKFRKLGEAMFHELIRIGEDKADSSLKNNFKAVEDVMDKLANDSGFLYNFVKKLRPKYDDATIKVIVAAFQSAYGTIKLDVLF